MHLALMGYGGREWSKKTIPYLVKREKGKWGRNRVNKRGRKGKLILPKSPINQPFPYCFNIEASSKRGYLPPQFYNSRGHDGEGSCF